MPTADGEYQTLGPDRRVHLMLGRLGVGVRLFRAYAFTLLAETGRRVSEAIALDVADVGEMWLRAARQG